MPSVHNVLSSGTPELQIKEIFKERPLPAKTFPHFNQRDKFTFSQIKSVVFSRNESHSLDETTKRALVEYITERTTTEDEAWSI